MIYIIQYLLRVAVFIKSDRIQLILRIIFYRNSFYICDGRGQILKCCSFISYFFQNTYKCLQRLSVLSLSDCILQG